MSCRRFQWHRDTVHGVALKSGGRKPAFERVGGFPPSGSPFGPFEEVDNLMGRFLFLDRITLIVRHGDVQMKRLFARWNLENELAALTGAKTNPFILRLKPGNGMTGSGGFSPDFG